VVLTAPELGVGRTQVEAHGIRSAVGEIVTVVEVLARIVRGVRTATVETSTIAASATKTILIEFFISFLL
jgi:hypothetical protein